MDKKTNGDERFRLEAHHVFDIAEGMRMESADLIQRFGINSVNDIRNGLLLCKSCHFQLGKKISLAVSDTNTLMVSKRLKLKGKNVAEHIRTEAQQSSWLNNLLKQYTVDVFNENEEKSMKKRESLRTVNGQ